MHSLPEQTHHRWVFALEQRLLLTRVPGCWTIGSDRLGQPAPAGIETLVEHLNEAAEVVGLPLDQELFGQGAVAVAPIFLLEKPQSRAAGEQHLCGAGMNGESL